MQVLLLLTFNDKNMKNNWLCNKSKLTTAYSKVFTIMKLTVLLILLNVCQVMAKVNAQDKVTLSLNKVAINKILNTIEKQGYYRFVYNSNLKDLRQKISINVQDAAISDVLKNVLSGTGLFYNILADNLIVIREGEMIKQEIIVKGNVMDANGAGLMGVSVTVKGTSQGVTTDEKGNFTINAPEKGTLVFSFVGFQTQEVAVNNQTNINVSLTPSATQQLNEVVVIGYGTANKRDLTGSIVKVAGKDVADKPNANPVASLQSKVAGLSVVNNGNPGTQPDIRIRGTISINSVHPLYVVDGIFNDNIDYINPSDIESIEILKDPSSLAIFGVKGAAGVIAVTTKRAKTGQVLVNFNTTSGVKSLVDKIQLASGQQFRNILTQEGQNQAADNASDQTINNFVNNDLSKWPANTDWVDVLTRKAFFTTNNISVAASTDKNKFYMGVGYTADEGLVKHTKYQRITLSVSDEFKVSKAFKLGFNLNGSREDLPYDGNGPLNAARQIFPIVNPGTKQYYTRDPYKGLTDSANFDLYSGLPVLQNSLANPIMGLEKKWDKQTDIQYRMVGSVFAEVNFLKDFNFRTTLYADLGNEDKVVYNPLYDAYDPGAVNQAYPIFRASNQTSINQDIYNRRKFQGDYILNYKKNFGNHGLTVTAGITHTYTGYFKTHGEIKDKADDPIPDNKRFWYITTGFGDPTTRVASSKQNEATTASGLLRVLYNYNGKYYVNASFRRDGASGINGDYNKKFQNFWAVGAAWEITRENFMEQQNFFNFLKLKGSAGVLGNANTGTTPYPYYPTLSATSSAVFGNNIISAYSQNYLPDANLRWERVESQEVGVEFSALSNRLTGEINYYNKKTKDVLVLFTPSGVFPTLRNNGEISNKGFEFTAGWNQRFSKDLSLTVSGNLTTFKNKVLSIGYPLSSDPSRTQTGYPIGYFYGYVADGLYQNAADIANSPVNNVNGGGAKPGDLKYKDLSGKDGKPDGQIDDFDRTMIGNPTPDFAYGGSLTLTYKSFDLGVDVGGVAGNEIYRVWGTSEQKNSVYNYPAYYADAWHGEGTSNSVPIVNAKHLINRAPSTYGIENGSYFRIRTITLGYNLSAGALAKARIKNLRIFVSIQNLKTFKHNIGYSPEFGGSYNLDEDTPPSATSFGIDYGDANGALPRIISGGINISF